MSGMDAAAQDAFSAGRFRGIGAVLFFCALQLASCARMRLSVALGRIAEPTRARSGR